MQALKEVHLVQICAQGYERRVIEGFGGGPAAGKKARKKELLACSVWIGQRSAPLESLIGAGGFGGE